MGFGLGKAKFVHAQGNGKLERLADRLYSIIEGDSSHPRSQYFFALPMWGISPETGIKLGVSLGYVFRLNGEEDTITRPSMVRLNTSYTQYGQFNIRPSVDVFFMQNKYHLKRE